MERGIRTCVCLLVGLLWMATLGIKAVGAENRLEQVVVIKPSVQAYYTGEEGKVEAYLGGEKLTLKKQEPFEETGERLVYVFLLDISGSLSSSRLENIRTSLVDFVRSTREEDSFVLYTFGNEVKQVLDGSEDKEAAVNLIRTLKGGDANTLLFEAIYTAGAYIDEHRGEKNVRYCMGVISDGKDCADDTKSAESAVKDLLSKGIPLYTFAVENIEGDSEVEVNTYRSRFSSMATDTGGTSWTVKESSNVKDGLRAMQDVVLGSQKATFSTLGSKVSNQTEDFTFSFTDGQKQTRQILVSNYKADSKKPTASVAEVGEDFVEISFSEAMEGLSERSHYKLKVETKKIAIDRIKEVGKKKDRVWIYTDSSLKNGDYILKFSDLTDLSNEENPLKEESLSFSVKGRSEDAIDHTKPKVEEIARYGDDSFTISFSEAVSGMENNGNYQVERKGKTIPVKQAMRSDTGKNTAILVLDDYLQNGTYTVKLSGIYDTSEEKNPLSDSSVQVQVKGISIFKTLTRFLLHWWVFTLTLLVLILGAIIFFAYNKVRRNEYVVLGDEIVEKGNVTERLHVRVAQEERVGRPAVIWIGYQGKDPRRTEQYITEQFLVGRSGKDCQIYTDDPSMSRRHFILSAKKQGPITVTDAGSMNGTYVNSKENRIQGTMPLRSGDTIIAGNLYFTIEYS